MPRYQCRNYTRGIGGIARTQRSVSRSSRGYVGQGHNSNRLLLAFVVDVKERPVFDDRATQRRAVLIVVKRSLGGAYRIESVASIQSAIAKIFPRGSVQGIPSTLGHDVDDCACTAAVFRLEV